MGQNLWLHFGVEEHPFATFFVDVHQGYMVSTHNQIGLLAVRVRCVNLPGGAPKDWHP